jgi:lipid-A-disaccharide synthase
MPPPLRHRHHLPALSRFGISAKRHLQYRWKRLLALHRQHQPLGHLFCAPLPRFRAFHAVDILADLAPCRFAQLRIPLRQRLLALQQLFKLRWYRRLAFLKIRLDRKVDPPSQAHSGGLLHLLVHQNEVPALRTVSKKRRPMDFTCDLDLHSQPHHLLPRGLHIKRHPRDRPPQIPAERFQYRPESLRRNSRHAIPPRKIYTGSIATTPNPRIFLSAGEASGDHYGAQIIAELRTRNPRAEFFGLGGKEMANAGQERIVRAEDVAHMGITEVIRHAPFIYSQYRKLVASIKQRRPDVAVLIDFPDVNFRLARELKKLNIPVIYFVSPQLWAWKRKRLRWVQERVSRMMVIFPFEEHFYRARNVDARFVGHPLAELPLPSTNREDYAQQHVLNPAKDWIAILPGSRRKEVHLNLPELLQAASILAADEAYEFLLPVASTVDTSYVSSFLPPNPTIHLVPDAREALHHARASIVASGTATVQAAVIGNPFIVVYKVSSLTYKLAKRLIRYPAEIPAQPDAHGNLPIAMVNLIAGRRIVPELIQQHFTAANVAAKLRPLLEDTPKRAQMIADLAEVRRLLQPVSGSSSITQVCDTVERLLPTGVAEFPPSASNRTTAVL